MKIELSKEQYQCLVRLVMAGNWLSIPTEREMKFWKNTKRWSSIFCPWQTV